MKYTYSAFFLSLLIITACKEPVLILKYKDGAMRFTQGEMVAPLLKNRHIDFSNCDSFSVSFWEIDSIFSNRITFKEDIAFTYDTLDRMELTQIKKENRGKFDYYKAHWFDSYADTHSLYRICRFPSETMRLSIPFDSLAGIAVNSSSSDCDGIFKSMLQSFSSKRKIYRYDFQLWSIRVKRAN